MQINILGYGRKLVGQAEIEYICTLTQLIQEINETDLFFRNFKIGIRKEYTIEYVTEQYQKIMEIDTSSFVYGSGKRKTTLQKHYEKLTDYLKKLKKYAHHIKVCGDEGNRMVRMNEELTTIHKEVLENLTSTQGLLLRANRSIQAEGTYGIMKWDRQYKRIRRRGLKSVIFEFTSICISFNLYKYHLKKQKSILVA